MSNVDDLDDLRVFRVLSAFLPGKDRQLCNLTIFPGGRRDRTDRPPFERALGASGRRSDPGVSTLHPGAGAWDTFPAHPVQGIEVRKNRRSRIFL
jgi:hypothetical protein